MIRIALCALLAFSPPAAAQYPERPVTLLAGYPPGGLVDVVARLVAEGMKAKFPKGIAVVNRPGAAGAVAVAELVRSQPDGYTVVLTPHSALVIAAQINDLAYKTPDDYDPFINLVAYYPMIAVRTESPYQSIQELIAAARANPGKIRVGPPGEATSSHLNLQELMHRAGIKMLHVPYAACARARVKNSAKTSARAQHAAPASGAGPADTRDACHQPPWRNGGGAVDPLRRVDGARDDGDAGGLPPVLRDGDGGRHRAAFPV